MTKSFNDLIDRSNAFFAELAKNNRKDWFEPRKAEYVADIRKPAELLADILAEDLGRMTGATCAPKVFRIYRDVRFSKDKTPYNPHLHLMWRQTGREDAPVWFFGSSPGYLIVGTGLAALPGPALTRYRSMIDRDGAEIAAAIDAARQSVGAELSDWGPPPLKRVPKPYAPDHPQGDLLRRKSLTVSAPLPADWRAAGLVKAIHKTAEGLLPLWRLLDAGIARAA